MQFSEPLFFFTAVASMLTYCTYSCVWNYYESGLCSLFCVFKKHTVSKKCNCSLHQDRERGRQKIIQAPKMYFFLILDNRFQKLDNRRCNIPLSELFMLFRCWSHYTSDLLFSHKSSSLYIVHIVNNRSTLHS
jgi:hypothetical protein